MASGISGCFWLYLEVPVHIRAPKGMTLLFFHSACPGPACKALSVNGQHDQHSKCCRSVDRVASTQSAVRQKHHN